MSTYVQMDGSSEPSSPSPSFSQNSRDRQRELERRDLARRTEKTFFERAPCMAVGWGSICAGLTGALITTIKSTPVGAGVSVGLIVAGMLTSIYSVIFEVPRSYEIQTGS